MKITWKYGGIDPPFWWRPWIGPWAAIEDWWYRPRPVKLSREK